MTPYRNEDPQVTLSPRRVALMIVVLLAVAFACLLSSCASPGEPIVATATSGAKTITVVIPQPPKPPWWQQLLGPFGSVASTVAPYFLHGL